MSTLGLSWDRKDLQSSLWHEGSFFFQEANSQLQHAASSCPTWDQTRTPCTGSAESQSLDHQGSPAPALFAQNKNTGPPWISKRNKLNLAGHIIASYHPFCLWVKFLESQVHPHCLDLPSAFPASDLSARPRCGPFLSASADTQDQPFFPPWTSVLSFCDIALSWERHRHIDNMDLPSCPALAGGFFTTEPPGNPLQGLFQL